MQTKSFVSRMARAALAVGVAAVFATSAARAETPLVIATEGVYPPFNFTQSDGTITGFEIELALEICKRIGRECSVVAQEWDGIIPGLLAKKYDMIVASMFVTEERLQQVDFSDIYYPAAVTLVAPKDSGLTDFTAAGLAGKVIGAQAGTTQADYAQQTYIDSEIRLYAKQDELNLDMESGRVDLQIGDLLPMEDWVKKTPEGACCELVGGPITGPIIGAGAGIAMRKEDAPILAQINQAIADIRADGTYKIINDKYFDVNIFP
jgi:polar amino acid transport system substrate-binding protein